MILCLLQARVSSTRLPRKVLEPVLGVPMIQRQIERISRSTMISQLVVATSVDQSDDPLVELCATIGVECCRGSLDDVLDRFYRCALHWSPEHIVRLTGDCPLCDPELIDEVVRKHVQGGYDYTSNITPPTYPDGLDVEVMTFATLEAVAREARRGSEREHVTLYIHNEPTRFRRGSVAGALDLSDQRWTVDEPADLQFVRAVYETLYPDNPDFGMNDVLDLLDRETGMGSINDGFARNEGLERSLREETGE